MFLRLVNLNLDFLSSRKNDSFETNSQSDFHQLLQLFHHQLVLQLSSIVFRQNGCPSDSYFLI